MTWGDTVDWSDPIQRNCPLNQDLISWWMGAPNCFGGTRLQDLCNKNHGSLTSMDPKTDWSGSVYGAALDLDGTDDYIATPSPIPVLPFTVVTFAKVSTLARTHILWSHGVSASNWTGWYLAVGTSGNGSASSVVSDTFRSAPTSGGLIATGRWVAVCGVFESVTSRKSYVYDERGSLLGSGSNTVSSNPTGTMTGYIGRSFSTNAASSFMLGTSHTVLRWGRSLSEVELSNVVRQIVVRYPDMLRHTYRRSIVAEAAGGGGATPWLYARRQTQIIGGGMGL